MLKTACRGAQLGLVDGVVPRERLLDEARKLAAGIAAGAQPRQFTLYRCSTRAAMRLPVPKMCIHSEQAPCTLLLSAG